MTKGEIVMAIRRILKNGLAFILNLILVYIIILISPLLITLNTRYCTYIAQGEQFTLGIFTSMAAIMTIIFSFIFFMKFEFIFLKTSIGFSSTRKSFYIAVQILKIISSIALTVMYLIFINTVGIIFNYAEIAKGFTNISFFILIFIFIATLGEFCGIIVNTMSKFIVFLILFYLIIFFSTPILISQSIYTKSLNNIYLYTMEFILLILYFVFCIFNWLLLRKYSLK